MKENLSSDSELDDIINNIRKGVHKNKVKKKSMKDTSEEVYKTKEKPIDTEKKMRNELFGDGVPDYYKILGVSSSDPQEKINKKANEKMAQYHPDKTKIKVLQYPPDERKKQHSRYEAQYLLVREARDILGNSEKRKYYDLQRKTGASNAFPNVKSSFDEFVKLQESEMTEDKKSLAISGFKQKSDEIDKKRGFDSSKKYGKDTYKLEKKDFNKRVEDIESERSQMDATYMPEYLGNIGNKEFNKHFDVWKKKKEKKGKQQNDDHTMAKWEGISAYNDNGASGGNYMAIGENDDAYEDLYKDSKDKDYMFSTKLGSDDEDSLSSLDDEMMKEIDVSYVDNHNKGRDKTMKDYETRLKEREVDEGQFDKRTMEDESWKSVLDNPFNISNQMGDIVGNDITVKETKQSNNKDMMDAYKALMFERENN